MLRFATNLILAVCTLGVLCPLARAQPRYTVKDLGTLGGEISVARAVNAAGDVVGSSATATSFSHAFLYRNGVMTDLGVPIGSHSDALAVNASGQIVVQSADLDVRSFLYSNGQFTDLGDLGGAITATAINDLGQVTGNAATASFESHAFLYSNGMIQDLGTFGGTSALPRDINNSGQIVGSRGVRDPFTGMIESHGFLYDHGVVQDFGANAGPGAINDLGHFIAGVAGMGPVLNRNGQVTPLQGGRPFALNNNDEVVGDASFSGSLHAVIYEDGSPVDLNTLIPANSGLTLFQAYDINDSGLIVGAAMTALGDTHAFLLTPVPEPAGLTLVLLGVPALFRHRTKKA